MKDAMTERCKSTYATVHQNVARVIYEDFIMKMNPYMVARNVLSLGDKILAKMTLRGKSKTLQLPENKNGFHWLRKTNIFRLLT